MAIYGRSFKTFFKDLGSEISQDNVSNGAAALGYYLTLALFPSLILLLTLVPYLPIANLDQEIFKMLQQAMPSQAADTVMNIVRGITSSKRTGLLSFGILATIWAASSGTAAIIEQLNITYDVTEGRSYFKVRLIAIGLTFLLGALMVVSVALILIGDSAQGWTKEVVGKIWGSGAWGRPLEIAFVALRWVITLGALLMTFALLYYFGPDVEQKFKFITPGSILGVAVLVGASLLFRLYVTKFMDFNATYGSLGAGMILMTWLYISGLVMLIGSEVNALIEHYAPNGKDKGEKKEHQAAA